MLISVMKDILAGTLLQETAANGAALQACTKHNPCHNEARISGFAPANVRFIQPRAGLGNYRLDR
jgi:hypothetical protein